jgi:DNA-binding CsgD family transcriptional regulator
MRFPPYRDHIESDMGGVEPDLAIGREFPRKFSVPTALRNEEMEQEVKDRVHKLLGLARQILTERQYAVFFMVAIKEPALTEREIAKVLSISPGRVNQLRTAAMAKLRRAYDERT